MPAIRDIPKVDRPREKMQTYGAEKLSATELLAVLLGSGARGISAIELAARILKKFPNGSVANARFSDFSGVRGLGATKICRILSCFELGKRILKDKKATLILSPKDVWEELREIRNNKREHFVVLYLDTRHQEIKKEIISVGTLNANLVHPREVFEPAIRASAAAIIIAHNHPSGDTTPSNEDREVTRQLAAAGKILGIEILDHIIVSKNSFFSFKCENEDPFY